MWREVFHPCSECHPQPAAERHAASGREANTPLSTPTAESMALSVSTPTPTRTPVVLAFGNPPPVETLAARSGEPETGNGVLWGGAALAGIATATEIALAARRQRKEQEEAQARAVRSAVEAKNAAEQARRERLREMLKIRNWLQGQMVLRNALERSGLSEAEKERVRAESQAKGIGAALGVLGGLMQAAQERAQAAYRAMEVKIRRWEEAEAASEKVRKTQYLQARSTPYFQEEGQNRKLRCDYGKLLGGALLITFVDLFVAIPAHVALFAPLVIPG